MQHDEFDPGLDIHVPGLDASEQIHIHVTTCLQEGGGANHPIGRPDCYDDSDS